MLSQARTTVQPITYQNALRHRPTIIGKHLIRCMSLSGEY